MSRFQFRNFAPSPTAGGMSGRAHATVLASRCERDTSAGYAAMRRSNAERWAIHRAGIPLHGAGLGLVRFDKTLKWHAPQERAGHQPRGHLVLIPLVEKRAPRLLHLVQE